MTYRRNASRITCDKVCKFCGRQLKTQRATACQWCAPRLRDEVYAQRANLTADELMHLSHNHRIYGLTCAEFDALIDRSGRCCEVCGDPLRVVGTTMRKPSLWIDHDHATGEVRGLVCPTCNQIIRAVEAGTRQPDDAVSRFLNLEAAA